MFFLEIKNLTVQIDNKLVIEQLNLEVDFGSLHVLMGPNGSGKSSLAAVLMGHPSYQVLTGEIWFKGQNIVHLPVNERAKLGIFLAFQYPKSIPGLKVFNFLKTIYEANFGTSIAVPEFEKLLKSHFELIGLDQSFMHREVNTGFSGGERKRFEILQLLLMRPTLAIIDEIDSGLDVDALKEVANALKLYQEQHPEIAIILITHYQRILKYLQPGFVHIMQHGKIIKSGGAELVEQVEISGYTGY